MASKNSFAILDDSDDERPKVAAAAAPAKKDDSVRRNNNNDRNTKGGRGPREAREGKRTFDRRSGTGRGKETKKGGGGARNWGSDKQEAKKAEGHINENEAVENVPAEAVEEPVVEEVVEEEDKTMTLEEYLASKKASAGDSLFGSKKERSIEEGNEFAGKEPAKFVEEDFLVLGAAKTQKQKKEKKEVQRLDVNFRVSSGEKPSRDDDRRGGRGGRGERRGGGRGGRGEKGRGDRRSGGRGGRGRGINVMDASAFPSL